MKTTLFILGATVALAACSIDNGVTNSISRSAAKEAVTPILAERFPGLPAVEVSDCVIDNAVTSELLIFTRAAALGPDESTYRALGEVLQRPKTIDCISNVALQTYMGRV